MLVIHEEKAEYAPWVKLFFIVPAGVFIAGLIILVYYQRLEDASYLVGLGVLLGLLFFFIMPRKYQIYQDKLKIVLGSPLAVNIPLSTIKEIRRASGNKAFIYSGVRFVTSTRDIIEIIRIKGVNYVISRQNGDSFLEELNEAIKS